MGLSLWQGGIFHVTTLTSHLWSLLEKGQAGEPQVPLWLQKSVGDPQRTDCICPDVHGSSISTECLVFSKHFHICLALRCQPPDEAHRMANIRPIYNWWSNRGLETSDSFSPWVIQIIRARSRPLSFPEPCCFPWYSLSALWALFWKWREVLTVEIQAHWGSLTHTLWGVLEGLPLNSRWSTWQQRPGSVSGCITLCGTFSSLWGSS